MALTKMKTPALHPLIFWTLFGPLGLCIALPGARSLELTPPTLSVSNSVQVYQQPLVGYAFASNRLEAESQWNATAGPFAARATPWVWWWTEKKSRLVVDLQEGWIEWTGRWVDVRLGQQSISWGSADQINPTDIWNPFDLFDLFQSKKLGNAAARVVIHPPHPPWDVASLELIATPFFRPSQLPIALATSDGTGFELSDSRMLMPLPTQVSVLGTSEPIVYGMNTPSYPVTWQFGSRLRLQSFLGADVALTYLNVVETLPRFAYTAIRPAVLPPYTALTLHPSFHRLQQFGVDAATDFAWFGQEFSARLECAFALPDNARALTAPVSYQADLIRDPYVHLVLGLDHTFAHRVFGTVLYMNLMAVLQERIGGREIPAGSLTISGLPNYRPWDRNGIAYFESRLSDRFKLSAMFLVSLKNADALIRPAVHYQWNDKLHSSVHADFFVGSRQGFYGQFYQDNRMGMSLRWFAL